MPYHLTHDEIRNLSSQQTFSRGRRYQRQEKVLFVDMNDENQLLFGEVEGSYGNIYDQEISFPASRKPRIQGFCTCPVGYNCKHVIAVLLEWLLECHTYYQQHQALELSPGSSHAPSPLALWQRQTEDRLRQRPETAAVKAGQQRLLYLLVPGGQENSPAIQIIPARSKWLKNGGWGKPQETKLTTLKHIAAGLGAPLQCMTPLDHEIIKLLFAHNSGIASVFQKIPYLEDEIGLVVLNKLLKSERCFYQSRDNPPLSPGPSRKLHFNWQEQQHQSQLQIVLENHDHPHQWLLLPTDPPWYLDLIQHQCGPLEQPLTTVQLQSLLQMPAVPQDQLKQLSYFLWQHLPSDSLPLPVEPDVQLVDQPPTPSLMLHAVKGSDGKWHHLARLRFYYGSVNLPPCNPYTNISTQMVTWQDQTWQITRYSQHELQAREKLQVLNFMQASPSLATPGEMDLQFKADSLETCAQAWKDFLDTIPQLEEAGWHIQFDSSFCLQFEGPESLVADIDGDSQHDWFGVGLEISHKGQKIQLLPLLQQWLQRQDEQQQKPLLYPLKDNRWLEIPANVLEPVVTTLVELVQEPQVDEAGRLQLPRAQAHSLVEIEDQLQQQGHQLAWQGGPKLRQLAQKLQHFQGIEPATPPAGLNAHMRSYQQQGLDWLQFLREYGFNGVLADDMGLGKTLQTLSHLLLENEHSRLQQPALIVAPTSILSNWQREANRFTPGLKTLLLHGPKRTDYFQQLESFDVIITSYTLLTRDLDIHLTYSYDYLILDEAQAIKNPQAKSAQAARKIQTAQRLCLTGTPLENHLGELWSLFHFLMPGFLGSHKRFKQLFRTPIEKHHNSQRQQQLQQRLAPFVLRRTKQQVAQELPEKTQMVRQAELGSAQAKLYESLRLAMVDKVSKLLQKKGLQQSRLEILDALLKLRQACCDPRLVKLDSARQLKQSAKLTLLVEMLQKLLAEDRKILVFSQFTSMLRLIEEQLTSLNISYSKLTGQTRKRDEAIAAFQQGPAQVFLISLKAGGVGLNLTAADTVIHYDPWWNPAVENQATDRTHRIGQDKPVFVYKLVASGTIEEKILHMQEKKQQLANSVYRKDGDNEPLQHLEAEDIMNLLTPMDADTAT